MEPQPNLEVFAARKRAGERIVMVTAYDLASAQIAREAGIDALLVGDSLGMVVLGHETTLPVTIDDMVHHTAAVVRARPGVPVIADMPYGSFHVSPDDTVRHAIRLVKDGGATAVKIEGGRSRGAILAALLAAEIPVMGHLGLTPQSVHRFGGFRVQGRGKDAAARLLDEAAFLEQAGCFAMVLECIPAELAARVTAAVGIPTIGIGAGPGCDGQILVFHDLLGLYRGRRPRFVKAYADLGDAATTALRRYAEEVRGGVFPAPEHCFHDEPQEFHDVPQTDPEPARDNGEG
ncbi:MAG: 3-methyl-2-oxobutanoate hydroxymethyltransferase [bacterium]|nr:3-methyl-2-oxobutanoate hydroxymethyltransferase [bacterium]